MTKKSKRNTTKTQERRDVKHPLWRKKVDSNLITKPGKRATHIPSWVVDMANIKPRFKGYYSMKDQKTHITIEFNKKDWKGWIVQQKTKKGEKFRLWFGEDLKYSLQKEFSMSYMRDVESRIKEKESNEDNSNNDNIEDKIPFWEFLDIEFDTKKPKVKFVAHYKQKPIFPKLFKSIIDSTIIKEIEGEIDGKEKKSKKLNSIEWKSSGGFKKEMLSNNVIYMLLNQSKKKLYIGETSKPFSSRAKEHNNLSEWEFYKYIKLPDNLANYRVLLERMLIKMFSSIMKSNNTINTKKISDYTLTNKKIDK
jgi:hypothetical protein